MKVELGTILLIFGLAATLPVPEKTEKQNAQLVNTAENYNQSKHPISKSETELDQLVEAEKSDTRVKREEKNHEIVVHVSRGGGGGTTGTINYSYKFKRSLDGQETIPVAEEVVDETAENERVKREEKNHEIGVHVSRGGGGGTTGTINYSYKFKRSLDGQHEIPVAEEVVDETAENERVKREEKNHEIGVHVSRGGGGGTTGTINYSYKFKRSLDGQDEIPVAEDVDETAGNERVKREEKNHEIGVHVSRGGGGGTTGTINYSYKFKRSPEYLAEFGGVLPEDSNPI